MDSIGWIMDRMVKILDETREFAKHEKIICEHSCNCKALSSHITEMYGSTEGLARCDNCFNNRCYPKPLLK